MRSGKVTTSQARLEANQLSLSVLTFCCKNQE